MTNMPLYHINAFTWKGLMGNPAAVILLDGPVDAIWMQTRASSIGFSETAFVFPISGGYQLRWFTPKTEVELCGHATLATAFALWESGVASTSKVRFSTKSGWLTAQKTQNFIELDFPIEGCIPGDLSEEIITAIGGVPDSVWISGAKWLLEFSEERDIVRLSPNFRSLETFEGRGLIVTARSERPGIDFISRYFAPWVGIDEDPVTGSAHCILGPYWQKKLARDFLTAMQVSKRGGLLKLRLSGDRVYIGGQAEITFQGVIDFP